MMLDQLNALPAAARSDMAVRILYTNYRGETADRLIVPDQLRFGETPWHPEPQWVLDALDLEKGQPRTFAVKDIASWSPCPADVRD